MNRIASLAVAATLALTSITAVAQASIAPPTTGILVSYQYWPVQYVQFVGNELPYSMIELDTDTTGKQPLYNVLLTERATGKRTAYVNSDALLAGAKAQGMDAYKVAIAWEAADAQAVGAASTLRFTMTDGKPLQWRFVQGSDITEQGAGLTPLPTLPIPVFAYREQAAVAGEGTALQIGDTVSAAEMWKEISQPPYFVAYRGALSLSAHMTVLLPGKESWTVTAAPTELKAGAVWEMDGEHGAHRTLRVTKVDGAHAVITGEDRFQQRSNFTVEATRVGDGWSVERVRYAPLKDGDKHYLTLQFTAPLTATGTGSTLDMTVGKKAKVATASIALTGTPADRTETVAMQTPAWAKGKTLTEETVSDAKGITTTAQPAK